MAEPAQSRLLLPWKTRARLFLVSAVTDASRRQDGTVNRRLFSIINSVATIRTPPDPKPRNGVKTLDITIDASRDLWFRLFVPTNSDPRLPVIVFFHGGGFVYLAPDFQAYDHVCRRFARKVPAVVVSVNYRLAPEHRYPAQHEDCFDVLRFLDEKRDILPENADVSRCFLAGDSAGGNLAHHVAKRASELRNFTHLKVIGVAAIQPFFGGEERTKAEIELKGVDAIVSTDRTDWMWKALIPPGSGMNRDHPVINVSGPNAADISKLEFPATVVVVAGFDSLKDWQRRYYKWLKESGKEAYLLEYPNMFHAFYGFPELPESGHLINEIKNFIHKLCSKHEDVMDNINVGGV